MPKRITNEEYQALVRNKYGSDLVPIEPYIGNAIKIKHQCNKCGDIRLKMPAVLLRSKSVQTLCCYQLPTTESYIAELEAYGATLRPIGEYEGRQHKSLHLCLLCGSEREMKPIHILRGHGCFICAKENQSNKRFKRIDITLAGYSHSLQGYEPQALALMLSYGANPKNIITKVSEGKPVITYRFKGKVRTFIPDFYHQSKNRVVEVKSDWTLGIVGKTDIFRQNKAKAKATIKAGYNFTLMMLKRNGERVPLPRDWFNMTKAQLRRELSLT